MKRLILTLTYFSLGMIKEVYMEACSPDIMSRCTEPLRVVTDNKDLGFASSQEELQDMCPKLIEGLRCIDNFTENCLEREHRAYFNTLYTGTTQVIMDLCNAGDYQTEYLSHAQCMRNAQADYQLCAGEYQLRIKSLNEVKSEATNTEQNVQVLCCSFKQYLSCSEEAVNETCGQSTAKFTKGFLDRMSGPLVQAHCQNYSADPDICPMLLNAQEQPQVSAASSHSKLAALTILLSSILIPVSNLLNV